MTFIHCNNGFSQFKKFLRLIGIVIATLFIVIFNHPWQISTIVEAVEIDRRDPLHCVNQQIVINGNYYFNIFNQDHFSGKIALSGYDVSLNSRFDREIDVTTVNGGSVLSYYNESNKEWVIFGDIYSTRFLNDIVIALYDSNNEYGFRYVVSEVSSYDEAITKMQEMSVN